MRWIRSGLFVGLLLVVLSPLAHAQDVQWGVRGGATVSNLRGDVYALAPSSPLRHDASTRTTVHPKGSLGGVQLAGFVSLSLRNELAVQAELQYAQKGHTLEVGKYESCGSPRILCRPSALERESSLFYRLSYLQVPALLKVRLPFGDAFRSHLVGGGSVGSPVRSELSAPDFWFAGETDIGSPDPRIEIGAVMGLEMSYRLGSAGTLLLDARFNPGVTDIPLKQTAASVRTSTVGVGLGYAFPWRAGTGGT